MLVQIKDNPSLVRDTHSKALLSTDRNALNEYKMKRQLEKKKEQEQQEVNNRLTKMEDEMREIKHLLVELIHSRSENGN
jgi:Zn-dependent M16 (insulinase) family peptidase